MPTKHARCSASAAHRWINCPGSVALSDQCPDPGSSSYADEGTVAHNLAELKQSIYEFESTCGEEVTLEHYLAHVALFSNADAMDDAQDKVRLMTVHAAKGLEFAHVFLTEAEGSKFALSNDEKVEAYVCPDEGRDLFDAMRVRTSPD